jgi:hypothetical protein
MNNQPIPPLINFFRHIKDPGIGRNKVCPLIEVIAITLLAVMAFAEGWLRKPPLENGIPKHDVYRRVFSRLKSEAAASCFMTWVRGSSPYAFTQSVVKTVLI